jgi:ribonuclease E
MERRYGLYITVQASDRMQGANFAIEKSAAPVLPQRAAERSSAVNMEWGFESEEVEEAPGPVHGSEEAEAPAEGAADERRPPRKRRRRGRRDDGGDTRGRGEPARLANGDAGESAHAHSQSSQDENYGPTEFASDAAAEIPGLGDQPPSPLGDEEREDRRGRRRRRGRRGGRRGRDREAAPLDADAAPDNGTHETLPEAVEAEAAGPMDEPEHRPVTDEAAPEPAESPPQERQPEPEQPHEAIHAAAHAEPARGRRQPATESSPPPAVEPAADAEPAPAAVAPPEPASAEPVRTEPEQSDPLKPARKGWWQRRVTVD